MAVILQEPTTGSDSTYSYVESIAETQKVALDVAIVSGVNNLALEGVKVRGSGLVVFSKVEDRMINGNLYQSGSYIQNMPLDSSGGLLLCTGANDLHMRMDARTDGDAIFNLYENTHVSGTTGASGTQLQIHNRSRHASVLGSVIDAKLFVDPIVAPGSVGDIIHTALFMGGSGVSTKHISATVATSEGGANWLLEAGSCYYFQYINQCGRPMNADWNMVLHEHGHS